MKDSILKSWQNYIKNPDSKHPCENFKKGWEAGYSRGCFADPPKERTCQQLAWHKLSEKKPDGEISVLTRSKHGLIEGFYNDSEGLFSGYYFQDISWHSEEWAYIS